MSRADRDLGTVLVTGGAGFIGTALARSLAERAEHWVVLDNLHPQVHGDQPVREHAVDGVELVVGDVTDPSTLDDLFIRRRPDTVVHLAAETGTSQSLAESTRHGLVNVVGTTALLDAMSRIGHVPRHFVLSSSRAVYGEGVWQRPDGARFQPRLRTHAALLDAQWEHGDATYVPCAANETAPAPVNIYAATKLAQEHIIGAWAGSHDSAVSILRLQNVYGPGQSLSNPYTGIVSLFMQLARTGESIPLYEDGEISRDFVFIEDVASALAAALENVPASGQRLVDVGSGARTSIRELAGVIAEMYGAPVPHVTGQFRDGDVRHAACSVEATIGELDWRPRWPLDKGLVALRAWIEGELSTGSAP